MANSAQIINTNSNGQYQNSAINCNNNEECTIICDTFEGCDSATINCPKDYPCTIECVGDTSCKEATFICPIGQPCDITCDLDNACQNALFNATYSSSFNLRECRTGTYVCTGVTIYFPPSNNGIPRANITGDNSLSAGTFPVVPLQFYAINGWSDVNVVNYEGDFTYPQGDMYCLSDYSSQCDFATNAWACDSAADLCQTLTGYS